MTWYPRGRARRSLIEAVVVAALLSATVVTLMLLVGRG